MEYPCLTLMPTHYIQYGMYPPLHVATSPSHIYPIHATSPLHMLHTVPRASVGSVAGSAVGSVASPMRSFPSQLSSSQFPRRPNYFCLCSLAHLQCRFLMHQRICCLYHSHTVHMHTHNHASKV